ncbi:MAG: DUF1338 family protein [Phycisphaerales bacterium]|nr:DUF1338 family protein [Phycisphaerales bacterium]
MSTISPSIGSTVSNGAAGGFADKVQMQHRLFGELSAMFAREVPMYDRALLINRVCNTAVCDVLKKLHVGFDVSAEQIDRTSGERHGAIRIGRPDEYRWIGRFFAQFAMEPHNFYDMTNVGSKSQPIIATAFRSSVNPEHRVFSSVLVTDYFAPETKARIEALVGQRQVFSDLARELIEKGERQGGLDWADAERLIGEGTGRIFKWTGQAKDHALYKELCDAGFKIAADIACFQSHHLNHLTPNTFCMDLYTSAMKFCLAEMDETYFRMRATRALGKLRAFADKHYVRLSFRHLSGEQIAGFGAGSFSDADMSAMVDRLVTRLGQSDAQLSKLNHAGFKDFTEGPSEDTPVLLRQDAYKALTEAVTFTNPDGTTTQTTHTARFGEIEQRFYATTPKGRELYDKCLAIADAAREKDASLPKRDFDAYEKLYSAPFAPFPKTLDELVQQGLVRAKYSSTESGRAARGSITITDLGQLVKLGYVRMEGLRYEDFLPVSAAGIFASNLNQYGTKSTAATKPTYTQAMLEAILGRSIIDTDTAYRGIEAASVLRTYEDLGIAGLLGERALAALRADAALAPAEVR